MKNNKTMIKLIATLTLASSLVGCAKQPLAAEIEEQVINVDQASLVMQENDYMNRNKVELSEPAKAVEVEVEVETETEAIEVEVETTEYVETTETYEEPASYSRHDYMMSIVYSLPEASYRGLSGISIVPTLDGWAGMTYVDEMRVEVADDYSDHVFSGTVVHEIGHIYHLRTGADQTAEWQNIFNNEWAGQGYYGSNNVMEAFADTFKSMYMPGSYGTRSLSEIPASVAYIQNLVNSGQ